MAASVSVNHGFQRAVRRWYPLKKIAVQLQLVAETARFVIVAAGRRSGKTERAKRKVIKAACNVKGDYFIAAPTYSQVKLIYWDDMKLMCEVARAAGISKPPSESELIIYLPNGSRIYLIGLDKPKRIEGKNWKGGIIDEGAYIKESAWINSVMPALNTKDALDPEYKAWCWIIGKPDGTNHFYEWFDYAQSANDPEWAAYTWKSSEVLDEATLAAARRSMSAREYRQEYEASFETASGRIYDEYSANNYVYDVYIRPDEVIHYYCDFNRTPMSHGVAVVRGEDIYVLDEFILNSAKGYMNVMEFCEKYKNHENKIVKLFGDRSGSNDENHNFESEYILMEKEFEKNGWVVDRCVPKANPPIKARQNSLNARILNAAGEIHLFVDPVKAKWNHKGLATTVFKEGSAFQEEQGKKMGKYQHITTGLGYMTHVLFPIEDEFDLNEINDQIMWRA